MTRRRRTVLTLATLAFLMPIATGTAQVPPIENEMYTISGSVGLPGVTILGLPGEPISDESGRYSTKVDRGWTGTVTPLKEGFVFAPTKRVYRNLARSHTNENYAASVLTFKISGNVGVAGVKLRGLPGDLRTDSRGFYTAQVEYGWSGAVAPLREGYAFEPNQRRYVGVTKDFSDHNYDAQVMSYTISGTVGAPGVTMQGLPGKVVSASSLGRYQAVVPYGWSGTVVPKKDGYGFDPASIDYDFVRSNHGGDYRARPDTVVISDVIQVNGELPLSGVTVTSDPGGASDVTDSQGRYRIRVPYGWTGFLRLAKEDYEFPEPIRYTNVTHHLIDGERTSPFVKPIIPAPRASAIRPQPILNTGVEEVLMIPTSEVDPKLLAQTREDIQVMLEILREKLSEPRTIMGVLYDFGDFFGGSRSAEALYLDGYGAVFVMRVDFPLSFSPAPPAEEKPDEEMDPVWQRARQKLYAPRERSAYGRGGTAPKSNEMTFGQFQEDLAKTLRHAANIRNMDPLERIVVTIIGQSERPDAYGFGRGAGMYSSSYGGSYSRGGASYSYGYGGTSSTSGDPYGAGALPPRPRGTVEEPLGDLFGADEPATPRGRGRRRGRSQPATTTPTSVLTILAHRSDVDSFASGGTNLEQFLQRVKVFSY